MTFAGRNVTHKDYGIFVSIKAKDGKYVSLSGHQNSLARGIKRCAKVDRHTVTGFATARVAGAIPVDRLHLHQAYYRYPSYNSDESPYGGAGLQVIRQLFLRGDDGVYRFGWQMRPYITSKGSLTSF